MMQGGLLIRFLLQLSLCWAFLQQGLLSGVVARLSVEWACCRLVSGMLGPEAGRSVPWGCEGVGGLSLRVSFCQACCRVWCSVDALEGSTVGHLAIVLLLSARSAVQESVACVTGAPVRGRMVAR